MPNPTKPTTNLTREHVVDAVADLLYSNKTARTSELGELMQLFDTYSQAKEREAEIRLARKVLGVSSMVIKIKGVTQSMRLKRITEEMSNIIPDTFGVIEEVAISKAEKENL